MEVSWASFGQWHSVTALVADEFGFPSSARAQALIFAGALALAQGTDRAWRDFESEMA